MGSTFGGHKRVDVCNPAMQIMKTFVKPPVMIIVVNVGAIFMTGNVPAMSHTKKLDTR